MKSLAERDKKVVWHPFTQAQTAAPPLEIIKAEGVWLHTVDGKKYLDANSSWWVNVHGHANKRIGAAIAKQFNEVDHVVFAGATHPKAVELAEKVCAILPKHFAKVFFSDDGSTAVEVALKMAFQYYFNKGESRKRVLALQGAYHGDTFGSMSVSQRGYFNAPFEHFFFDVDFLDFPTEEKETEILSQAKKVLASNEFAALIVEPLVQGAAGMRMYRPEFLDALVRLAKEHHVQVIFDEVMTGWGRTGKLFAMDHCTNKPDVVCLSKGLTAGILPLGLTVTTDEIYNAFLSNETAKAFLHGHSFTGNPIACAAACENIAIFQEQKTKDAIDQLATWNADFLQKIKDNSAIKEVRQQGTILAIEMKDAENTSYFSSIREQAYNYFLENEMLIRPLGNVIFINPPYCISKEEYMQMREVIEAFICGEEFTKTL